LVQDNLKFFLVLEGGGKERERRQEQNKLNKKQSWQLSSLPANTVWTCMHSQSAWLRVSLPCCLVWSNSTHNSCFT